MKLRDMKKRDSLLDEKFHTNRFPLWPLIFAVILLLVCSLYLRFVWGRYKDIAETEVITLAQSLESLLDPKDIATLSASDKDLENIEYVIIKRSLERLVKSTTSIRFAYLLCERDGEILFMVDSELSGLPDYSPPGQIYEEASDIDWVPFHSNEIVLTDLETDRWGTWISVLVPVLDSNSDEIIAVLGLDYDGTEWYMRLWKNMVPDIIYTLALLLIFLAFLWFQKLKKKYAVGTAIYRDIFEQTPTGIAIMSDERVVSPSKMIPITINPMFEHILGRSGSDLEDVTWTEITHADDLQTDLEKFKQFKNGDNNGYSLEKRFIRPDGSSVWTQMKVAPLSEWMNKKLIHLCLLEDITTRKEAEEALRLSEKDKSILLSNLPGMAFRCKNDCEWTVLLASDGCLELTGYSSEALTYNKEISYNNLIVPKYRKQLRREWDRVLNERLPFKHEYEIKTRNGEFKWVLEMGEGLYDDKGQVESLEGIILDISDQKRLEETLVYNNEHDMWTGLYNRQYFEKILDEDSISETNGKRALVGVNLNAVNSLSMTYGFQYSQQLIKKTVEVLKSICTDTYQLFQTHLNRFVFYAKGYEDKEELLEFCQIIINSLEFLFFSERTSFGIGIVEIEEDSKNNSSQLLKNLLIASEQALNILESETAVCFFNKEMEDIIARKETLKRELGEIAVGKNSERLYLQFQPVLDLATNKICGFEALARLNSETLGFVSPLEFIPLTEETKLIVVLGKQIIRQSLQFLNTLSQKGLDSTEVAINISAIQLLSKDFTETLFEIIDEMKVKQENICLEITESLLASNYQEICRIAEDLRNRGLKIAIDDFGTGYSSLARIRELPTDYIKIDKFFIDRLLVLKSEYAITGDIISMAHKLGSCVIAEGIEDERQLQYLKKHGCDRIQGYLIAKPLDKEVAIKLLTSQQRPGEDNNMEGKQD